MTGDTGGDRDTVRNRSTGGDGEYRGRQRDTGGDRG